MFVQQECIKLINCGSKDLHFCKIFNLKIKAAFKHSILKFNS